jgi:peptide/nickel transport system permease protein
MILSPRPLRSMRSRLGQAGVVAFLGSAAVLVTVAIITILAQEIWSRDPGQMRLRAQFRPPSVEHLMGTDELGRDVLIRVIYGARVSLGIAASAALVTAVVGAVAGFVAGFLGGALDTGISRFVDMLMAFPAVLLAIIMIAIMGGGIVNLVIAIMISSLPHFVRVARSTALSIRESDFILASVAIGAPVWWQMLKHVVPNGIPLVVVLATARMGTVILTESSLSFLGLGVPPGTPSWGAMISEGRNVLLEAPWVSLAPGTAIMLVVLCFNLLGDGLRDLLDPRMRGRGVAS